MTGSMGAGFHAIVAACAVAAAVLCGTWHDAATRRLRPRATGPPAGGGNPIGIEGALARARATLLAGGTLTEAFERQHAHAFAVPRPTVPRLVRVFESVRTERETDRQIAYVASGVRSVHLLSASLGCEAVRCLDVVADDYRRMRLLDDLRRNAFAVPEATVRLLSALPAATMLLGEMLGASPLAFLTGSEMGLACLAFGAVCYAAGMWWMRLLLKDAG